MPLQLIWQARDIALYETGTDEASPEEKLLAKVDLDFELGPLALTVDEDRHRLLAALAQLQENASLEEAQIDLHVPDSWGVTHKVPHPGLPEQELKDHLRWELSKALVDSEDQYQYSIGYDEDGSPIIAAMRYRLLEPIQQVVQESGFTLSGLFLAGGPWDQINLVGPAGERAFVPTPPPVVEEPVEIEPEKPKITPREPSFRQRSRTFPILLIIALVIIVAFAIWKFTTEKPEMAMEPTAEVQESAPSAVDTSPITTEPADETTTQSVTRSQRQMPPSQWTTMLLRINLLDQILQTLGQDTQFGVVSFTENNFQCQVISANVSHLGDAMTNLRNLNGLSDCSSSLVPPLADEIRGIVTGVIFESGSSSVATPHANEIVAMGKKYGLHNTELIFTGAMGPVRDFLNEVAASNYTIYKVIIVPWGENEFRTVLDI